MSEKVVVLGAGRVGRAIALDLATDFTVLVADRDRDRLESLKIEGDIETRTLDLSDARALEKAVDGCQLAVGAVPGKLGFSTLEALIPQVPAVVDISFFPEDPFRLQQAASDSGCRVAVDCGVAPGLSNMIAGFESDRWQVETLDCMVGGLPVERRWPYQYKAPFSPADVIEEYVRPARLREKGQEIIKEALSEPELVDIGPVGTLEAFNTDGLRTLLTTLPIPNMRERTLRYPGHLEYIRVLKASGFFSAEPVAVGDDQIRPRDLASVLLFRLWKLEEGEPELTVLKVCLEGCREEAPLRVTYSLVDRTDPASRMSSMARTTGYTCTAAVRWLLEDDSLPAGIIAPEILARQPGCFEFVLDELADRGVRVERSESVQSVG